MADDKKVKPKKRWVMKDDHKKFANLILDGVSKIDAYLECFDADVSKAQALLRANSILAGKNVAGYIDEKRQIILDKIIDKNLWERENSVYHLKHLIKKNTDAQQKVEEALEDEIDFIIHTMEENPEDTKIQEKCIKQILSKRQKLKVSRVTNDAVISAVSELNKMHGFNEENINMFEGQIIFEDQDAMED